MYKKVIDRVGEIHTTKEGYSIKIIECFGVRNNTIIFLNNNVIVKNVLYKHIKSGSIKNPYHRSVHGIGYFGQGKYSLSEKKYFKIYDMWKGFLERCYSTASLKKRPTYKGCSVDKRWHNFQNFAEWFNKNYIEGFELDKDILVKGNKVYSPETCCFVPHELNQLLTNTKRKSDNLPITVKYSGKYFITSFSIGGKKAWSKNQNTPEEAFEIYKTAKESYIKEIADKWRGQITEQVYQALINYKVEITD